MKVELSLEQLEVLHCALITRGRIVSQDWLPIMKGLEREELLREMQILPGLRELICRVKVEGQVEERVKAAR